MFDLDSRLYLRQPAISDISDYLKYQSRQHIFVYDVGQSSLEIAQQNLRSFEACVC